MTDKTKGRLAEIFGCRREAVKYEYALKNGMTNDSFLFSVAGRQGRYIARCPGAGTGALIDRRQEHSVYEALRGLSICDDIVHLCRETGLKVTRFWEGARTCDKDSPEDVAACMGLLRDFHGRRLSVAHAFCPFERIGYYEGLLGGRPSAYADYADTKARVMGLREFIGGAAGPSALSHIDAVPSNFVFLPDGGLRLIDWEYAAMQDPHIDIAMFSVYAMYGKEQIDGLAGAYFRDGPPDGAMGKIYAYVAVCGLLWSNWCEFKNLHGVPLGGYARRQYRYAREFCRMPGGGA